MRRGGVILPNGSRDDPKARRARVQLASFYSHSAEGYAELWAPELLPLSRALIEHLPLRDARRVLEVGSGVGALLTEMSRNAQAALIVGTDLSHGMLERADARFPRAVMDAASLGFADAIFDVVVSTFVLFHLPTPASGVGEMARVLRRGGVAGTATWGEEHEPKACDIWLEELEAHGAPPPDRDFAKFDAVDTVEKVARLMQGAGLVIVRSWMGTYRAQRTPDDFLAHRTRHGRSRLRFEALAEEARARCLRRVRTRVSALEESDLEERAEVVYVVARRP